MEMREEFGNIEKYCCQLWQQEYDANKTGQAHRALEPKITTKIKYTAANRRKENIISRLRLGKCCLNKYLHDINKHPGGCCADCHVPETVEHFLLNCKFNGIPEKVKEKCKEIHMEPSIRNILTKTLLLDLIAKLITNLGRKI